MHKTGSIAVDDSSSLVDSVSLLTGGGALVGAPFLGGIRSSVDKITVC